jgi:kinase-associated protein B
MEEKEIAIGDTVQTSYRSGSYIGELIQLKPAKAIVKILAVRKHPTQGDLHNPFQAEVPMFHQRRALAYHEKVSVPLGTIKLFEGDVPSYRHSLLEAVDAEITMLSEKGNAWSQRSIQELEELKKDYFPEV